MRIMLLVTDLERGGTPRRIARLARHLRDAGADVHAGCLAARGPVSDELERDGVPTFACDAAGPGDVRALARLSGHVRRVRPDVIHSALTHANAAARLVGLWHGIAVIGSTATIEVERRWHVALERLTARLDRLHVVHGRALADHVRRRLGLPRERIVVLPPSIDERPAAPDRAAARAALGVAEGEFVVLWVGRLDPVKRVELVIGCAEMMSDLPARFLIVGDGPAREDLAHRAAASSAAHRVHLLGWREDLPVLHAAADAFLFPSRTEGLPNAVLEAMAAGLPVVGSDIPALRELCGRIDARGSGAVPAEPDGAEGDRLLLVRGGSPGAFADALRRLAADPELRSALGARAASFARGFVGSREPARRLLAACRRAVRQPPVPTPRARRAGD